MLNIKDVITMRHRFLSFLSPAKLNLGLKIMGQREDGYHLLKSVFCLIDLYDKIDIQITPNGKISLIDHQQAWFYQKDLAYKAAKLLQQVAKTNLGANIRIHKLIPSGAGMGGGSSNAATVLVILNQLWEVGLSIRALCELGLSLGADVPFFIRGHNALVEGIGEQIVKITLPQQYFVIIKPDFHIPTKNIFAGLELDWANFTPPNLNLEQLITSRENDLEVVVRKLYPQINQIFDELNHYGKAVMTGSGSAIYLTFTDKNIAKNVATVLSNRYNTFLAASLLKSPIA